jgi:ABC-type tungstate transport system permease subunit
VVRVTTVFTPYSSGLLPHLVPAFEAAHPGVRVEVTAANDVFTPAMNGDVDLLVVHYYHLGQPTRTPGRVGEPKKSGVIPGSGQGGGIGGGSGSGGGTGSGTGTGGGAGGGGGSGGSVSPGSGSGRGTGAGPGNAGAGSGGVLPGGFSYPAGSSPGTITTGGFILDGYGLWPLMLFANQAVLIGPPSDPARVRGLPAIEAMRRIATTSGSYYLANISDIRIDFLEELLLAGAGISKGDWYVQSGTVGTSLLQQAAAGNAYTIWGDETASLKAVAGKLEPLVVTDPLLQRAMVSIVINPRRVGGINADGAHDFQTYLTEPATQARILAFREPGFTTPTFWPVAASSA